jgi:transposase
MKNNEKIELSPEEMEKLLERIEKHALTEKDYETLMGLVNTVSFLNHLLREKQISIKRLKSIFGIKTEKASHILKEIEKKNETESGDSDNDDDDAPPAGIPRYERKRRKKGKKRKKKGHGRNGAYSFTGAEKIFVPHETLKAGDNCPECLKGRLYDMKRPGVIVTLTGNAPIQGTVYELQKLRCSPCGAVFTADMPEGVEKKYDEDAASMIALLKYGCGFPFYRLENLQKNLGMPIPAATQWEIVSNKATMIEPVYQKLIEIAAQGEIIHNDDTSARILSVINANRDNMEEGENKKSSRKGIFTTGIISILGELQIALFFTGRNHSGENMEELLKHRENDKSPPIQMCDALASNVSGEFETILCNCLSHGRRKFVEIIEHFPKECWYAIEILGKVYHHDDIAKEQGMSHEKRLAFHQEKSSPLVEELKHWIDEQFDQKKVEPNSSLGKTLRYFQNHWDALTRFLHVPGAPLDNNIVERALKKAILHRKNSYFFKTENGAHVGDIFMTIIETCRLNQANPFDYLSSIQKHFGEFIKNISIWMPWNYQKALDSLM